MKRSEINGAIRMAEEVLSKNGFRLPPFSRFGVSDWKRLGPEYSRVKNNGLGWDVTDFGEGDFERMGAALFTIRNGNYAKPEDGTPYAEKLIILKPGQRLPLHFHWSKTEDIINRGGGVLAIDLYGALENEEVDEESPVTVYCDGERRTVEPGRTLLFQPGESITLTPRMYHRFWASEKAGVLICGEISTVNDDNNDNRFAEKVSRFAHVEEDEAPLYPLCNERV